MNKIIITFTLITTFSVQAIEMFKADYTVFKDGKKIGLSSIELSQKNDIYSITDNTNGTHGMASFLGFKRNETSEFKELDGKYKPLSYKMNQKVAFNKRQSEYTVNYDAQRVTGNNNGKKWDIEIPTQFLTPNLVSLKLFQDICAGKTENLSYFILKKGKIKNYQFQITSSNDGIIEVDKIHSNPKRITKTWLDTTQQCIPVRTYHIEEDEDALESKLLKFSTNN